MKAERITSVHLKVAKILLIFIVPLFLLLIAFNWYVVDLINKQSEVFGENILEVYSQPVESELEFTGDFFQNYVNKNLWFRKLVYADTKQLAYARLRDVNKDLQAVYSASRNMAGHIIYHLNSDQFREYYSDSYSFNAKKMFRKVLKENSVEKDSPAYEEWVPYKVEEQFYLLRFFHFKETVVMGIYNLSQVEVPEPDESENRKGLLYFADESGQPLTSIDSVMETGIVLKSEFDQSYVVYGGMRRYLVVEKELGNHGIRMVYITPYYEWILENKMIIFLILFSVFVVLLLVFSINLIYKSYTKPLQSMIAAMIKVKEGDMNIRMQEEYQDMEFSTAKSVFNNMMDEIQNLKIADYEQRLKLQEANMSFLQIQIRPHFILNCLNVLFSLAQEHKYKEIQETVVVLSHYLRDILKDDKMMVSVDEELKSVKNYIYLRNSYTEEFIRCEYIVDKKAASCKLPSLSILTFVENSIKHGRQIGKEFVITIKVNIIEDFLNITVLDNGIGFSQENLEYLNNMRDFSYVDQHIGIQNVLHRFSITYGGKSEVLFSDAGGACVDIFIPLKMVRMDKDGDFDS